MAGVRTAVFLSFSGEKRLSEKRQAGLKALGNNVGTARYRGGVLASPSCPLPLLDPLGTWMMTGNGVMHNGTTILDEYGHNLDRLKVGEWMCWQVSTVGSRPGGAAAGPAQAGTLPDSSLQPPFFQGRGHGGRGS